MSDGFTVVTRADGQEILDWRCNSLIDLLSFQVSRKPDQRLYTFLGDGENETESVSMCEFAQHVTTLSGWLLRLLPQGTHVILLYDNGLDYLIGLMAGMNAGLIPVSGVQATAFGARDRFLNIRKDSGAVAAIGNQTTLRNFQKACAAVENDNTFRWISTENRGNDTDFDLRRISPDSIAMVQYTSGATRSPRGVELSHRNILFNLYKQGEAFGYENGDCGVNWLPLSHDMGLIGGALMALAAGGHCVLLPPETVAEEPGRWLKAISRYRASFSGGPDFMYDMSVRAISAAQTAVMDLSSWKVAFTGSDHIRPHTIEAFDNLFSDCGFERQAFLSCYGLAEATLLVTASEKRKGISFERVSRVGLARGVVEPPLNEQDTRLLANCGSIIKDINVFIIDEDTNEIMPEKTVGEIFVCSASIAHGYINRSEESKKTFFENRNDPENYLLRTGDRGFILDNCLFVTGRSDHRIAINDCVFDPDDLVSCLNPFSAEIRLSSICIFVETTADMQILFVLAEVNRMSENIRDGLSEELVHTISASFGKQNIRLFMLRPSTILKTPSGKIRLSDTRDLFFSGDMFILAQAERMEFDKPRVRIERIEPRKI
ncbi:AMP-binding protein [Asaia prunellae]|uniref:AMP-binding protein n=1 Tax=Asaia prunellae TaxID=610245 RepID=UPI0004717EE7|nr:AMP-binding protein [Asaia prunellae]